jgi:hypothetical protein
MDGNKFELRFPLYLEQTQYLYMETRATPIAGACAGLPKMPKNLICTVFHMLEANKNSKHDGDKL